MYGRHTIIFPLAVLILLAGITFWIERTVQAPLHKPAGSKRHDPDYIVNNFSTIKTDINGNIRYILAATDMKHYPDDDTTHLQRPRFTQYAVNKPYTQVESQEGLVSPNGETVQFMGNVKVVRQAFKDRGEMVVRTQYLKVTPETEIATTDRPVVITQAPKTVVHATGMVYNKKQRTMHLLSRVRVHYERPGKAASAVPAKRPAANTKQTTTKKTAVTRSAVRTPSRRPQ
jgi:lipopolysaccharide export system protein LptC